MSQAVEIQNSAAIASHLRHDVVKRRVQSYNVRTIEIVSVLGEKREANHKGNQRDEWGKRHTLSCESCHSFAGALLCLLVAHDKYVFHTTAIMFANNT